ncbi:hypothetical protein DL98DRAFT_568394 [Cadophora sp. DSE1049]|nr:hypothetical protein DL98DRAFT_568394 [Cadophora sp. DSE1049]
MPPIRTRKRRIGKAIPVAIVEKVTKLSARVQSHIIATGHVRRTYNIEDSGPDFRRRYLAFTKSETSVVYDYLTDPSIAFKDKGKPWQDIVKDADVLLLQTRHLKLLGRRDINEKGIQRVFRKEESLINAVAEEETELSKSQADSRIDWSIEVRKDRPRLRYWKNVYFCDEFHFGIGPQVTKRIKRLIGKKWRYWKHNVHRKKMTAKDTKAKAWELDYFPFLNVFVIVGPDYRRFIPYDTGSPNSKMTTKVYLELLKQLKPDFNGITFC